MLLVQEYLLSHSFADLAKNHGVYATFNKAGYKWCLNYDMLESKETDLLAQECRGLILATADGSNLIERAIVDITTGRLEYDSIIPGPTVVICYPLKRFFNNGQEAAAPIDWNDKNLLCLEKRDGTLANVAVDPFTETWCVSTRSVPDADIPIDGGAFTFRTLFEKALLDSCHLHFDELTSKLDRRLTYCFELCTPINRVIVDYHDFTVTLLTARSLDTMQEIPYDKLSEVTDGMVPIVQAHDLCSIDKIIEWVSTQNPLEHEGVVLVDSHFNRLKVKNASYVAFNRARDILGSSERNCLELILQGKDDDVHAYLPSIISDRIVKIKSGLLKMIERYDDAYMIVKAISDVISLGDKKTFALNVQKTQEIYKTQKHIDLWTAPFYQIFSGKAKSTRDFIESNRKDGTWSNAFLDRILELSKQ